ncbi:hypothetical protein [Spiroplasma endosymbiont of Othius punctulatus]|uniref:FoF1 ATP synthase subunit delta/epsilon n=1 Tax=Spiroplasma endosymbiont of Othius punctulatus TaxID=3066289 RepID=UPI0030D2CF8F
MDSLELRIVTPNGVYVDKLKIDQITIPTTNGQVTLLKNHMPLIGSLRLSYVKLKEAKSNTFRYIHIHRGIFELKKNVVKIVTQNAYDVDSQGYKF